jgi:membrane protein YdbS with pleckstrin-like domain
MNRRSKKIAAVWTIWLLLVLLLTAGFPIIMIAQHHVNFLDVGSSMACGAVLALIPFCMRPLPGWLINWFNR